MNLIEWTYEYFQNRYGLKNVADKKFSQFVGSILRFKDKTPRFRLFGRFLQLYDELSEQDLKLYVDIVHNKFKSVLNFQILESDEVILIPTQRAIDYFKQTFVARLTQSSMSHCLKIVSYTPSLNPLVITLFLSHNYRFDKSRSPSRSSTQRNTCISTRTRRQCSWMTSPSLWSTQPISCSRRNCRISTRSSWQPTWRTTEYSSSSSLGHFTNCSVISTVEMYNYRCKKFEIYSMNMLKSMAISKDLKELKYEVSVSKISKSYA